MKTIKEKQQGTHLHLQTHVYLQHVVHICVPEGENQKGQTINWHAQVKRDKNKEALQMQGMEASEWRKNREGNYRKDEDLEWMDQKKLGNEGMDRMT